MSVNEMADAALARQFSRSSIGPLRKNIAVTPAAPGFETEFAPTASSTPPTENGAAPYASPPPYSSSLPYPSPPPYTSSPPPAGTATAALQALTRYIPTEVLTFYVASVAITGPDEALANRGVLPWLPFLFFLVATPTAVWVAFAVKLRERGMRQPLYRMRWPIWEMFAASVAFSVWAFALPDSPFSRFSNWYSPGLGGLLVLAVSFTLSLIAPLVQPTSGA